MEDVHKCKILVIGNANASRIPIDSIRSRFAEASIILVSPRIKSFVNIGSLHEFDEVVEISPTLSNLREKLKGIKKLREKHDVILVYSTFSEIDRLNWRFWLLAILSNSKDAYAIGRDNEQIKLSFFKAIRFLLCSLFDRKLLHYLLARLSLKLKSVRVWGMPNIFVIETTNYCDQRCPVCETGAGLMTRPRGMISLENFKKIIDKIYLCATKVSLYYMGEPFLNKDIYEMIKYARLKRIQVSVASNGGKKLDVSKLMESGLHRLDFKLSGLTQEHHNLYRVRGSLENVLWNVREIIAEKKRREVFYPNTELGFIVMKHNEHQTEEFINLAKELEVDKYDFVPTCLRTIEQGKEMLPENKKYWLYDPDKFSQGILAPRASPENECQMIWHSMVINWDGTVAPCCYDMLGHHTMGNILENDLGKIWNSKKYRKFRKQILRNQRTVDICKLCLQFKMSL